MLSPMSQPAAFAHSYSVAQCQRPGRRLPREKKFETKMWHLPRTTLPPTNQAKAVLQEKLPSWNHLDDNSKSIVLRLNAHVQGAVRQFTQAFRWRGGKLYHWPTAASNFSCFFENMNDIFEYCPNFFFQDDMEHMIQKALNERNSVIKAKTLKRIQAQTSDPPHQRSSWFSFGKARQASGKIPVSQILSLRRQH